MKERRPLPPPLEGALGMGIAGLAFIVISIAWVHEASGFLLGGGFICMITGAVMALFGIRARPLLAIVCFGGIGASLYLSASVFFRVKVDRLEGRIADVRKQVDELRSQLGDEGAIQAVIASSPIQAKYKVTVSQTKPPSISFLMELYGIDNGSNLVLDPSGGIKRFFGANGRFQDHQKDWEPYRPVVFAEPVRCQPLGSGWYLISFT